MRLHLADRPAALAWPGGCSLTQGHCASGTAHWWWWAPVESWEALASWRAPPQALARSLHRRRPSRCPSLQLAVVAQQPPCPAAGPRPREQSTSTNSLRVKHSIGVTARTSDKETERELTWCTWWRRLQWRPAAAPRSPGGGVPGMRHPLEPGTPGPPVPR